MPKGDHPLDAKIDEANAALKDKRSGGTRITVWRRGDGYARRRLKPIAVLGNVLAREV